MRKSTSSLDQSQFRLIPRNPLPRITGTSLASSSSFQSDAVAKQPKSRTAQSLSKDLSKYVSLSSLGSTLAHGGLKANFSNEDYLRGQKEAYTHLLAMEKRSISTGQRNREERRIRWRTRMREELRAALYVPISTNSPTPDFHPLKHSELQRACKKKIIVHVPGTRKKPLAILQARASEPALNLLLRTIPGEITGGMTFAEASFQSESDFFQRRDERKKQRIRRQLWKSADFRYLKKQA